MDFQEKFSTEELVLLKRTLINSLDKIFAMSNTDLNFCANMYNKFKSPSEPEINPLKFDVIKTMLPIAFKDSPDLFHPFLSAIDVIRGEEYNLEVSGYSSMSLDLKEDPIEKLKPKDLSIENMPDNVKQSIKDHIDKIRKEKLSSLFVSFSLAAASTFFTSCLENIPEEESKHVGPQQVLAYRVAMESELMVKFYSNIMGNDGGTYLDMSDRNNLHTKTGLSSFYLVDSPEHKGSEKLHEILVNKHVELGDEKIVPMTYGCVFDSNSLSDDYTLKFFEDGVEFGVVDSIYDSMNLDTDYLIDLNFLFSGDKKEDVTSFLCLNTKIFRLHEDSSIIWYYVKTTFGKTFVFTSMDVKNPIKHKKEEVEKSIQDNCSRIVELKKQVKAISNNKDSILKNITSSEE
jgi:hypothetical protein